MKSSLEIIRERVVGDCWIWPGYKSKKGYGRRKKLGKMLNVHRTIFEALVRKVPRFMVLDHLCRNRCCVNPYHLEIVTVHENIIRGVGVTAINFQKTHCKNGHPLFGKNMRFSTNGARLCKICTSAREKKYREKRKLKVLAGILK